MSHDQQIDRIFVTHISSLSPIRGGAPNQEQATRSRDDDKRAARSPRVLYRGGELLAAGSPAIDKGTAISGLAHDFEGKARPAGKGIDVGAFEFGAVSATDGGGPPPADSGSAKPDAVAATDGSGAADGAAQGDGSAGDGPAERADDGCSCALGSRPVPRAWGMSALLLLLWPLRRRR